MKDNHVYLGLGSNLSTPVQQLQQAIISLKELPKTHLLQTSSAYHSAPMGPADQPDYVNAVVRLATLLSPTELLSHCQQIELAQGRQRKGLRWGARTLDIDILLFNDQIIDTTALTIPHCGMKQREFVLYPLAEISPDLKLPCGNLLKSVLETCPRRGLTRLDDVQLAK